MGKKFLVLIPAVLLVGCANGPGMDPVAYQQMMTGISQSNAQLWNQVQSNNAMLQQQQAATAATVNQDPGFTRQEPDGKWVFCQRLGGAAIACRPM